MSAEVKNIPLEYAPVPPEMLWYQDKEGKMLSSLEIRTWCALAMHRNLKTGDSFPSNKTLAEILNAEMRSVKRAIARLVEAGFLLREEQTRNGKNGQFEVTVYTISVDGEPVVVGLKKRSRAGGHSRHPAGGHSRPARGDELVNGKEEEVPKEDSPEGAETSSAAKKKSPEDHTGKLVDDLEEIGFFLDRDHVSKVSGNFGALKRKGVSHAEIVRVRQHMVAEWPRVPLSPQQALSDIRGERRFGKASSDGGSSRDEGPRLRSEESKMDPALREQYLREMEEQQQKTWAKYGGL